MLVLSFNSRTRHFVAVFFHQCSSMPQMSALAETKSAGGAGTFKVKSGMARMLKGGVIMDVIDVEQAKIAEAAGAAAVMASGAHPCGHSQGRGVARMATPK